MKFLCLISAILFLTSCTYSQNSTNFISISQIRDGGDGSYYTVIGMDKESIDSAQKKFKFNEYFTSKFVVDKRTFKRLNYLMSLKCIKNNSINKRSVNYFVIRIVSENDSIICYLENENLARPYFENIIEILDKENCNDSCKNLLAEFQGILRSLDYKVPGE